MANHLKIDQLSRANLPDQERFDELAKPILADHKRMKNVYLASDFRPQVKIYFGGTQHVLVSTTWRHVVTALRIADAAIFYFWKYRRARRHPADHDFNFGYDSAKSDAEFPFIKEMFEILELRLNAQGKLPDTQKHTGPRDLQPSRIRMMQCWAEFRDLFKQVYFQCPDTPKTSVNLKYGKDAIESLDNMLRTINSTVRDVESEVAPTTAVLGEPTTAALGESTTAIIGESTTAVLGESTTNLFQK